MEESQKEKKSVSSYSNRNSRIGQPRRRTCVISQNKSKSKYITEKETVKGAKDGKQIQARKFKG